MNKKIIATGLLAVGLLLAAGISPGVAAGDAEAQANWQEFVNKLNG